MDIDSDCTENWSPSPAPVKKAASKKAAAVLGPSNAANVANIQKNGKALEDIYQKKTQLEHILLRPDTYIGSVERQDQKIWIHDGQNMVYKPVSYVPGLYKIFDEILVNAADNKVRDSSMDTIKVTIDQAANMIKVWNNGNGIPVQMHKEEGVYIPELIFGHLLTSSNYDDNEKKVTGGRNGYGAKLANIFSTKFVVETADGKHEYKQVFTDNMGKKHDPQIKASKDNYTCITFYPDLAKFGMTHLEDDTVALMRKRVFDVAGVLTDKASKTACKVYLNGERLALKNFQDYCELYLKDKQLPHAYEKANDRWEVCIAPNGEGYPLQMSFVNSICTITGGTHVNYIVDQVAKELIERAKKKDKHAKITPHMVKCHLFVFINCKIENPTFGSQSKENMTLRASSFGSKCELSKKLLDAIVKMGILESILTKANAQGQRELKKSDGAKRLRILGIPKLDDANDAGGTKSGDCTLILTEGDSAKTLAISGLSVVGRDKYGVFPLRGKLLNVRDASTTQVTANAEIQALKQILGLQHGKAYNDVKSLRYGHLMIMTDQDHDGSHIKGLIMNFLHTFYPSLLKVPSFLQEFITPIIKAKKGNQTMTFYTMPQYEEWKKRQGSTTGWSIKYYKGLGTSTREEAREYFSKIRDHRKQFIYTGNQDDTAIEMAFSKKKVDERKEWLSNFQPGTFLDNSADNITYSDFIHKELILFSRADLERSIPCMVDGLKPGQRKILFACFKRNLRKDIKVAQLAGYVSEHAAYHHGEASLASTIINLAQDYVGSNNINLLVPSGQFGTRLQGGKDAASARYIFTRMAPLTRHLFNESDDQLLAYLNEEGQSIEPEWYIPILPTVLVNGAEGIGTGWSTYIPNYNPNDIVENLKRLLVGEEMVPMQPWYRGFKGSITESARSAGGKSYTCKGIVHQVTEDVLEILELPVRKWTQDYKEFLEGMVKPDNKEEAPVLAEYREHHTDVTVHFLLNFMPGKLAELEKSGLDKELKMATKFSTSNMMLFDKDGKIKHYASPEEVLQEFYDLRLTMYEKRRLALLKVAEAELLRLSNRMRFILAVISGELKVNNRKKAAVEADLEAQGYDKLPANAKKSARAAAGASADADNDDEDGDEAAAPRVSYDYLLSMPIYSLTLEKVEELQRQADDQSMHVQHLAATSAKTMWAEDLDNFLQAYNSWEADEEAAAEKLVRQQQGAKGKPLLAKTAFPKATAAAATAAGTKKAAAGGGAVKPKKKKAESETEESDYMSEDDDDISDFEEDDVSMDIDQQTKPVKPKPASKPPVASKPAPAAKPAAAAKANTSKAIATTSGSSLDKKPSPTGGDNNHADIRSFLTSGSRPSSSNMVLNQPAVVNKTSSSSGGAAASSDQKLSLTERLAGRFQKLNVAQSDSAGLQPGPLETTAESPAPAIAKTKAVTTKAAAAPKAAAAAKRRPMEKKEETAAAKPKPAARKKKVIDSESEEESDVEIMSTDEEADVDFDGFDRTAPSPAVAPKGKKIRQAGTTPLAFKTASRLSVDTKPASKPAAPKATANPAAAAKPASKPAKATAKNSDEDEEVVENGAGGVAAARPQRARRPVQNISYIEIEDSEAEEASDDDSGSDFQANSEDDQ